jgi:polyisoprenoid-binding protein YceI
MASNLWDIDVGCSSIRFSVRHMVITKVHGCFARWSGTIALDEQDLTRSSVDVRIDAASIEARWAARDTQVADRDARLKSADFLDVAKYPEIRFRSKRIDKAGPGYRLVGDLSLHGVEREVALEAQFAGVGKDPSGNQRASFSARVALDRRDYGLVWDPVLELGSVVVGEKVGIAIEIEAVKKVSSASVAA